MDSARHGIKAIYTPSHVVLVRAPALSMESFVNVGALVRDVISLGAGVNEISQESDLARRVLAAITFASPSLSAAIGRFHSLPAAAARRVGSRVFRYASRMSTRATPYGAFAGSALAQLGDNTSLHFHEVPLRLVARPDMGWLNGLCDEIERRPEVLEHLSLAVRPGLSSVGGRLFTNSQRDQGNEQISLKLTPVVSDVLRLARDPIPCTELIRALLTTDSSSGRSREKITTLLINLIDAGILISDMRMPLTVHSPATWLSRRLLSIPQSSKEGQALAEIVELCGAWRGTVEEHTAISNTAQRLRKADVSIQVDANLNLRDASIHTRVGERAARAAELLLGMSPYPKGLPHVQRYKAAFISRYGEGPAVSLIDVVDAHRGIGPLSNYPATSSMANPKRNRALKNMLVSALVNRSSCVDLDDYDLAQLATSTSKDFPSSVDIAFFLGAQSDSDVDRGDFDLTVSPFVGSRSGGRTMARFAHNLGTKAADSLRRFALLEEGLTHNCIWAELFTMPQRGRLANLLIRPRVREYEILEGAVTSVESSKSVSLSDILLCVSSGNFCLIHRPSGKRLVVTHGNMLNPARLSAIAQLIVELGSDGVTALSGFDWGEIKDSPFLPRVSRDRIIMSPAQWRISPRDFWLGLSARPIGQIVDAIHKWRDEWRVPEYVYMAAGDNRILLNLLDKEHCVELARSVSDPEKHLVLQEMLPRWKDVIGIRSNHGQHLAEFVVSLVRAEDSSSGAPGGQPCIQYASSDIQDRRFPGSEWLYLKIYCPVAIQNHFLEDIVARYVSGVIQKQLAQSWFFIRYTDPDPHIRLRFKGDPAKLQNELLPLSISWARSLQREDLCGRFTIDTYEREVDRYGGPFILTCVEELFCVDSVSVLDLIQLVHEHRLEDELVAIVAFSIEGLVRSLGLGEERRRIWYELYSTSVSASVEYRKYKSLIPLICGQRKSGPPWVMRLHEILTTRVQAIAAHIDGLMRVPKACEREDVLSNAIVRSIVHMHCNRLAGSSRSLEAKSIELASLISKGMHWIARRGLLPPS
jgi:thiopeptide-type bacteriocin biosynthesis protein